ncbi:MAG: cupin [Candidatus Rokubacteria bacterium 13_1_20CM_4_68_9]|nr:MAG: cupin [Candidatus Rokubacteria bacterium 13_1_20CM_4_68_9]
MTRFRRTLVVAASELLLLAGVTATGSATPGTGVSDTILAKGTSPNGIVVGSRGNTEVAVREITIAPGGSTGWHYHEGALIAVVKSGTLTRTLHDCSTEQTLPGGSFVEPAGRNHVHIGRNLGTEPVVLLVTSVLPPGQRLSNDAPQPPCDR